MPGGLRHALCFSECNLRDHLGGMDATLKKGATCTHGVGVEFDGDDDYVDLVDVELGGEMTFAIWARWDAFQYDSALFDFGEGYSSNSIYLGNYKAQDALCAAFYVNENGVNEEEFNLAQESDLQTGEWTFVVVTIGSSKFQIYQDGVKKGVFLRLVFRRIKYGNTICSRA